MIVGSIVYKYPDSESQSATFLRKGDLVAIVEKTADGSWLKVQSLSAPGSPQAAWVAVENLDPAAIQQLSEIPIATATPIPTDTPRPTMTPDVRGEYVEMDIRELDSYTSRYLGDKVRLRGKVFNILGDGLQMWVREPGGSSYDNVAVVVTWDSFDILPDQVYEDVYITVYGKVAGTFSGTNSYGGTITQPLIEAAIIEK